MSELTIKGNNHLIDLLGFWELTPKEQKNFDWYNDAENGGLDFFRYRGSVYCLSEFMVTNGYNSPFKDYDGYASDSFSSGVLVKYPKDDYGLDTEHIKAYTYYS